MIRKLTKEYIYAFNSKSLEHIRELMNDTFILEDPVIKRVEGKEASLKVISKMFEDNDNVSFSAKKIYVSGLTSIIEFNLKLDDLNITGVDIIEWENEKMTELRAYLDIPKQL